MFYDGSRAGPPGLVYLVATSHLDTQWRWTVRDTIRDFLPRTVVDNLALAERIPGFVLSFEGAFRYQLLAEYHPRLWERVRTAVTDGRWRVAGAMLDAPDVNIPSPESLIRHVLYGRRFFERELGVSGVDVFLPDCFGFGAALPSIAAHCGLAGLSTSKLIKWMPPAPIPFDLGRWRGPDGSEIVAALHPEGYGEGVSEDLSRAPRLARRLAARGEASGVWAALLYAGIGDRGGALDDDSAAWLERSLAGEGPVAIHLGGSDDLFRDLAPEETARLPAHEGDLLLPTHGTGCLTSQAVMKRWNRKNEQLADAAERAAVAAERLTGLPYPAERLRQAWTLFLWHQMHDDLTGTSIPEAYRISWNDEAVAANLLAGVLADSVAALARAHDTRVEGVPLVVFNPLAGERCDPVEAVVRFVGEAPAAVRVFDGEGVEVPSQVAGRDGAELSIVFSAPLPPVGLAVFDVRADTAGCELDTGLAVTADGLESPRYRATIDAAGDLGRLFDRRHRRELLAAPAALHLLPDRSRRWPAWEILYDDLRAAPRRSGGGATLAAVERGPARVAVEVRRPVAGSTVVQRYRLAAGDAGHRLEVDTRIDWRTRGRLLKAAFPTPFARARATFDLGLGVAGRGVARRESYEVPAQQWADLSDAATGEGLSVLSDHKCGWDRPVEETLRLTLARSPRVVRKFRHQGVQDLGPHRCLYALVGHGAGGWREETVEQAARLNQPPRVFQTAGSAGPLGRRFSLLRVDPPAAAVRAVKRAEEGVGMVVRLQETRGLPQPEVEVALHGGVRQVVETDGGERAVEGGGAEVGEEGGVRLALGPFQPRTLLIEPRRGEPVATPAVSHPLALPFDRPAASFHDAPARVDFDGRGRSLPGELLPERISCGEIEFRLAAFRRQRRQCVACAGQTLEIEAAGAGEIALLLASVDGDRPAALDTGAGVLPFVAPDWAAPLGQWVGRRLIWGIPVGRTRPPFLRRHRVAWLGTHRHAPGPRDEPYRFCYLFCCRLPLPPGVSRLALPRDPAIRLFAATALTGSAPATRPAAPLFD